MEIKIYSFIIFHSELRKEKKEKKRNNIKLELVCYCKFKRGVEIYLQYRGS